MKDRQYLGIIGILITILAWTVLNSDHFPIVYRLIAPEYANAMTAYERMQRENFILKQRDTGFSEISDLLRILMGKDRNLEMTQIETVGSGQGPLVKPESVRWVGYVGLEISFRNSPTELWAVGDLEGAIKKRFLPFDVSLWSSLVFGIGVVLFAISLCIKDQDQRKT